MIDLLVVSFEQGFRRFRKLMLWALIVAVGLVALGAVNQSADMTRLGRLVSMYGALGVGLLLPSGLVGAERQSGAILLWLQQPGSLLGFYARRALALHATSFLLQLPFAAVVLAGGLVAGESVGVAFRAAVSLVLLGLILGSATVAFSCWGLVKDAFAAVVYTVATVMGGSFLAFEAMRTGTSSVVRHLMLPVDAMDAFQNGTETLESLGIILAHLVAWAIVAAVGLQWMERRPIPSNAFGDGG